MRKKIALFLLTVFSLSCVASFTACGTKCAHENTTETVIREATCSQEGLKNIICDECHKTLREEPIAKLKHASTTVTVVKEAICGEDGLQTVICDECHQTVREEVIPMPAERHTLVNSAEDSVGATCTTDGVKAMRCLTCGYLRETPTSAMGHKYGENIAEDNLKEKNLSEGYLDYYKTCNRCGERNGETFRVSLDDLEKYTPHTPTLTLYRTGETLSYGFNWTCWAQPYSPAVLIKEVGASEWVAHEATSWEGDTYVNNRVTFLYVCKAEVELKAGVEYTYKLYDRASEIGSEEFTFTAANPQGNGFTFASFSDSQMTTGSGDMWNKVLQNVAPVDFYLHSGDICDETKNETNWENMLYANREYFAVKPMMAASGNHETTYQNGSNEIYKHFNNNIPGQSSTVTGYYYSFTYQNALFVVLNTNLLTGNQLPNDQLQFLEGVLSQSTSRWKIVMMHCPMYSPGNYGSKPDSYDASRALRGQLSDMFAEYGVDLVIQGHDHVLSRTYPIGTGNTVNKASTMQIDGVTYWENPNGTVYVMNGPTGNQARSIYSGYETQLYSIAQGSKPYSWAEYTVSENTLVIMPKYYDEVTDAAKTYYSWGITKD